MIFNSYAEGKESVMGLTLVSCGHIFARPGREIRRPDGRDDWLLFYVARESETFYFDRTVTAQQGSFVLFAPGEKQHHIYEGSKTAEFYYIHFRCDDPPFSLKSSVVYDLPFSRHICDIFESIIDETQKKQPYYERLCVYKLLTLVCELERGVNFTVKPAGENFSRISRAMAHINRYYNEDMSLADYAKLCNMSKYHFLRVFENTVGDTPLRYRNNIRLEHAAELLRDEGLSVGEVSDAVGFSSPSYFSQAFKQKYGISPKEYKT